MIEDKFIIKAIDTDMLSCSVSHHKILLIDLENCPKQIQQLRKDLAEYSQVVICYAQSCAKIPLDWLLPLTETINSKKLKIFKMATIGKNSADFGISFFAGILMQQMPVNSHFVVISDDTDLDHVINLLRSQGRTAERVGLKKAEKIPESSVISSALKSESPIQIYCSHLITYKKNRPAKKSTLINSIKNKFKTTSESGTKILDLLIKQGALALSENRLIYNDQKISELSKI